MSEDLRRYLAMQKPGLAYVSHATRFDMIANAQQWAIGIGLGKTSGDVPAEALNLILQEGMTRLDVAKALFGLAKAIGGESP